MAHPAFSSDSVAVITGGAAGIGLAAAVQFAKMGMRVCIADLGEDRLAAAAEVIAAASSDGMKNVMTQECDVSKKDNLVALEAAVQERFGGTDILMNNAAIQPGSDMFNASGSWERILAINLHGVINGTHVFAPAMIERGRPGLIINTGSKQGITTPPGDPAYNVAKSGVKAFTESLEHELRNTEGAKLSAHLLIPGFVFTDLTRRDRVEKPDGAWVPEQVIDFMMSALEAGDFYILCPDNDVARPLDELRIRWAGDDIIEGRPALSRWHPDYGEAFSEFVKDV
ncbi:MAG: SDR family NAD(P)-dependent oxidoreductase [Rhizobiaceae bacterium]|nr:SDR family NAD(P)-dependent oxidoreductase [Rhizobiaceae bacterium]